MMQFLDSADHYDQTAYMMLKWTTNDGGGSSTASGRNGRGIVPGQGLGLTLDYQTGWVLGFAFNLQGQTSVGSGIIYELSATNAVPLIRLVIENDFTLSVYSGIGQAGHPGNLIATSQGPAVKGLVWNYVEIKIALSGSTPITAVVSLQLNGQLIVNAVSGSCQQNASSTITGLAEANFHKFSAPGGGDGLIIDDIYIADMSGAGLVNTFVGDVSLFSFFPNADDITNWAAVGGSTSTLFDHVNDQFAETNDDTVYIKDGTVNDIYSCYYQPIPLFGGTVPAIQLVALNRKDSEGTRTWQFYGNGGVLGSAPFGPFAAIDSYQYNFCALDSNGGSSWTQGAVNGSNWGAKIIS